MRKILLALALLLPTVALAQTNYATVKVQDTFYEADGATPFTGVVQISWPTFRINGQRVGEGQQNVQVVGGALSVSLWPSDQATTESGATGLSMTGFTYRVIAATPSGPIVSLWLVPSIYANTTVTLSSVAPKWANASVSGGNLSTDGTNFGYDATHKTLMLGTSTWVNDAKLELFSTTLPTANGAAMAFGKWQAAFDGTNAPIALSIQNVNTGTNVGTGYSGHLISIDGNSIEQSASGAITMFGVEGRVDAKSTIASPAQHYSGMAAVAVWNGAGTNTSTMYGIEVLTQSANNASASLVAGSLNSTLSNGYNQSTTPNNTGVGIGVKIQPLQGFASASRWALYADDSGYFGAGMRLGSVPAVATSLLELEKTGISNISVKETATGATMNMQMNPAAGGLALINTSTATPILFQTGGVTRAIFAATGNLTVGSSTVDSANGVLQTNHTKTLSGGLTDGYAAAISLAPTYSGAFAVTRANYITLSNPVLAASATVTDAAALTFDADFGTHAALAANGSVTTVLGSVGPTGSHTTVQGWLKFAVAGRGIVYVAAF